MANASSSEGSFTVIFENLRSSAASFSMYFAYSSSVVAPMMRMPPRASAGFMIFAASTLPSPAPAPTMVWISSMNSITSSLSSSSIAFSLSSNSPRYFVPAMTEPMSRRIRLTFLSSAGTLPSAIRAASPSTIADFPTPGLPTSTGLFLLLLSSIVISLSSSFLQPMSGSMRPRFASLTRSTANLERTEAPSAALFSDFRSFSSLSFSFFSSSSVN